MPVLQEMSINTQKLIDEIHARQGMPWNNGRINDYMHFPLLKEQEVLFPIRNEFIIKEYKCTPNNSIAICANTTNIFFCEKF